MTSTRTFARIGIALGAVLVTITSGAALAGPAHAEPAPTKQVTLRPVDASGKVAPGYTWQRGHGTIYCQRADRSPVATSGHVLSCSPTAFYPVACWRSADRRHAYCLIKARLLLRYVLDRGKFPSVRPAPQGPTPFAMTLADGAHCSLRAGGAAPYQSHHRNWAITYYCGNNNTAAVWAPIGRDGFGISRSSGRWTVEVGRSDGRGYVHRERVTRAYVVATA